MQYFHTFVQSMKAELSRELPGIEAQLLMAPDFRREEFKNLAHFPTAKKSGVLILLFPSESTIQTVFIQRNHYEGVHSGQISFPGGQQEKMDADLFETALREANEEIGIDLSHISVIGSLTELYIQPSNYNVLPVVAYTTSDPELRADKKEVSKIIRVKIDDLLDANNIHNGLLWSSGKRNIYAPYFFVENAKIWGATAMIVSELLEMIKRIKSPD